jgi:membrane carboxypeptidase/penicillin-binding protein
VYKQGFNINTPINLEFQKIATEALRNGYHLMIREKAGGELLQIKSTLKIGIKTLINFI